MWSVAVTLEVTRVHPMRSFLRSIALVCASSIALAACGGAGATTKPSAATTTPPAAASVAPSVVASVPAATAVMSPITPEATIAAPKVGWLAFDGAMLWVFTGSGAAARLDPATNAIGALTTVDATHQDGGFAVNNQGLWLNDFDSSLVYRVDPSSLKVVAKIPVGPNPEGLAVDPKNGAIWVANHRGGTVARIDPATNTVVATIRVGNTGPSGPHQVGLGLGSVWVGVPNTSSVYRIDPTTNAVQATIAIPPGASPCSGFAFGDQAVWMPSCQDSTTLVRIDPVGNKVVATIELGGYGDDPILIDGVPWLVVESTSGGPARLVGIDPKTNTIDRVVSVRDAFTGANLVTAAGSVWATDWANNQILRLPLAGFPRTP
jgi:YVTN family beta-propeller protein